MKSFLLLTPIFLFLSACATPLPIEYIQKEQNKKAVVRYIKPLDPKVDVKWALEKQAMQLCEHEYRINQAQSIFSDASQLASVNPNAASIRLKDSSSHVLNFDYVEIFCD